MHSFVIRSFSRNRIRQNIAAYAACADPYSSESGPEYLAFRAVLCPHAALVLWQISACETEHVVNTPRSGKKPDSAHSSKVLKTND